MCRVIFILIFLPKFVPLGFFSMLVLIATFVPFVFFDTTFFVRPPITTCTMDIFARTHITLLYHTFILVLTLFMITRHLRYGSYRFYCCDSSLPSVLCACFTAFDKEGSLVSNPPVPWHGGAVSFVLTKPVPCHGVSLNVSNYSLSVEVRPSLFILSDIIFTERSLCWCIGSDICCNLCPEFRSSLHFYLLWMTAGSCLPFLLPSSGRFRRPYSCVFFFSVIVISLCCIGWPSAIAHRYGRPSTVSKTYYPRKIPHLIGISFYSHISLSIHAKKTSLLHHSSGPFPHLKFHSYLVHPWWTQQRGPQILIFGHKFLPVHRPFPCLYISVILYVWNKTPETRALISYKHIFKTLGPFHSSLHFPFSGRHVYFLDVST